MHESVDLFASYLELFLNVLEFIAVAVSAATFFFLVFNKFSNAMKVILAPCGFNLGARLKAFFICRKSPGKKRAFLEYAMLRSEGNALVPSEWKSILNEFKAFYDDTQTNPSYSINNCTVLIGAEFSNVVQRYFEYFSHPDVKRAFGIADDKIGWILKIHIEEAYVTPTCLLTGLLARFEENWEDFIKQYISTAYIADNDEHDFNDVLTEELYLTFAWLLWGPSYELKHKTYWRGLCQISYGDECNSIPAVASASSNVIPMLQAKFAENRGLRYGVLTSMDLSFYENKAYYKSIRNSINLENAYFYDKVADGSFSFAAEIDSFNAFDNYKAAKYYCTAYVWLLFELDDDEFYSFKPEKSLAFFEHANLTDTETYLFLIETLIDKSIKHFTTIFSKPEFEGRKYRFVCALNDEITDACMARYKKIMASGDEMGKMFADRVLLTPKHIPAVAFAAYDDFFSSNSSPSYVEVSLKNKVSMSDFAMFYTDVYMESFPDPNERETFDNILKYLKNAETAEQYRYHIILVKDVNNNMIGGGIFDYFVKPNAGVIEFIAVKNTNQSIGIGTLIYNKMLDIMSADAFKIQKKKLEYIFCEIDTPEYSQADVKKYLYFWRKHHFQRLDFSYVQPSLSKNQAPVTGLWFTVTSLLDEYAEIPGSIILSVLYDFLKYAMQIESPDTHPDFQRMREEIMTKEVPLLPII